MRETLSNHFKNLPLFSKLCMVIGSLALFLSLIIILTAVFYYRYISSERLLVNARTSTQNAASSFQVNYNDILERFTSICGTKDFLSDLKSLSSEQGSDSIAVTQRLVQEELSDLSNCNYLVHTAMLLSGDGTDACVLYKVSLQTPVSELFPAQELAQVKGITFLPQRPSPFRSSVSVIPLLIPVSVDTSDFAKVDLSETPPDAYVVLLLDSSRLAASFRLENRTDSENRYFLVNASGQVLNSSRDSELPEILTQEDTASFLAHLAESDASYDILERSDSYLVGCPLRSAGLILLNNVPREGIRNVFGTAGQTLLLVLLMAVALMIAVSFLMTSYITRPINRLVGIVRQIQEDTYDEKQDFGTRDEVGQLCTAINQMYDTIQQQILRIRHEESEKYRTEIKMLTEQINPHFLYNTLECIQSEVIRGESETASSMIQYLADYLRIGLSYGADLITVSNELRHANAYVKLMNQRFHQSIMFMYQVTPQLSQKMILKTILQPLLENSIKHGFAIDAPGIPISVPTIEVNFTSDESRLTIEIADNGSGFSIEKTEGILYGTDPDERYRHVGLHNVYYRLITYYGKDEVTVTLHSIPYYRNSIIIRIPLLDENGA